MRKYISKFVLPNTVEFIRHVTKTIFLNHKFGKDTDTTLDPIVTRAKNLTEEKNITIATYERTEEDGR